MPMCFLSFTLQLYLYDRLKAGSEPQGPGGSGWVARVRVVRGCGPGPVYPILDGS